jgi:VacB/RNase II family 3'-5' exoribonuclease
MSHNQFSTGHSSIDLRARAHQAMLDEGFVPDTPLAAEQQLRAIKALDTEALNTEALNTEALNTEALNTEALAETQPRYASGKLRDLRHLLWSSIDNSESRDLDQIEVAERLSDGDIRVLIGIADVDALVPANTPLDRHAGENTTSVYTGPVTFPMLPTALSEDLTSLRQDADRLAIIMEMVVGADGAVRQGYVSRGLVRNHARLDYETVGAWLEEADAPLPKAVEQVPGLEAQLRLQQDAAARLRAQRRLRGALDFEMIEAQPVIADGKVVDLQLPHKSPSRYLIEDFMVAANTTMADLLERSGSPSIQRVVRTPERWPRIVEIATRLGDPLPAVPDPRALADFLARRKTADPVHFPDLSLSIVKLLGAGEYAVLQSPEEHAGHFGLAVYSYTHSTAPNRRYADLVTQRLLKAMISGDPCPYPRVELEAIARHCTERENAARKVERLMRKVGASALMSGRIGERFEAIVTGASVKGTYVRLLHPPVEGRVVHGEQGMDVGDQVRVRLTAADPQRGFIDFVRA